MRAPPLHRMDNDRKPEGGRDDRYRRKHEQEVDELRLDEPPGRSLRERRREANRTERGESDDPEPAGRSGNACEDPLEVGARRLGQRKPSDLLIHDVGPHVLVAEFDNRVFPDGYRVELIERA